MDEKFKVFVSCLTYNHSAYIKDTLDGFCMQQTGFPFVCGIIDDASTDGCQSVIENYLENHFDLCGGTVVNRNETEDYISVFARHRNNKNCYFAVILLKYNHHSIRKPKDPYVAEWMGNSEYFAICEGDDYWTDPDKLTRQHDFLESHPEYSMTCCRTAVFSQNRGEIVREVRPQSMDGDISPERIITKGGLYISTCGIFCRREIMDIMRDKAYCVNCHVGDYPLQIQCAMSGRVYYFDKSMAVYRVDNPSSWMGRLRQDPLSDTKFKGILSEIEMLDGFSQDYPDYANSFRDRINSFLFHALSPQMTREVKKIFFLYYEAYLKEMPFRWKVALALKTCNNTFLQKVFSRLYYDRLFKSFP